jgi:hypothetical protein
MVKFFGPLVVFLAIAAIFTFGILFYGIPNNWEMGKVVEVYTKGYYHPHYPLGVVVWSLGIIGGVIATVTSIGSRHYFN